MLNSELMYSIKKVLSRAICKILFSTYPRFDQLSKRYHFGGF